MVLNCLIGDEIFILGCRNIPEVGKDGPFVIKSILFKVQVF